MTEGNPLEKLVAEATKEHADLLELFKVFSHVDSARLYHTLDELPLRDIALFVYFASQDIRTQVLGQMPYEKVLKVINEVKGNKDDKTYDPDGTYFVDLTRARHLYNFLISNITNSIAVGVNSAATIANILLPDGNLSKAVIENLEEENPELVDRIKHHMFRFYDIDIIQVDGVINILEEVDKNELGLALYKASKEIIAIFRTAYELKNPEQKLDELIPKDVSLIDVEAARKTIVDIANRLEQSGNININYEMLIRRREEERLKVELKIV